MNKVFYIVLVSVLFLTANIATAAATPMPNIPGRTITFVNQCNAPVWVGFSGGAAFSKNSKDDKNKTKTCSTNANDCYAGQVCLQVGNNVPPNNGICHFINPTLSNYQLNPGGTTSVTIAGRTDPWNKVTWNGAIVGRTGCADANGNPKFCDSGDCSGADPNHPPTSFTCTPGKGFMQPATEAELTLNNTIANKDSPSDYYDVEMVNGVNIPVQITPTAPAGTTLFYGDDGNPYTCGSPGAATAKPPLGNCSWNFQPPSNVFVRVTEGNTPCSNNSPCSNGQVCGLPDSQTRDNVGNPQLYCGKPLGYWSGLQICGNNKTFKFPADGSVINCGASLGYQEMPQLTQWDLYSCKPTNGYLDTCYNKDKANPHCCGCIDWNVLGIQMPPITKNSQCLNTNQSWTKWQIGQSNYTPQKGEALYNIQWAKKACPTAYSYVFDDPNSTFTCSTTITNQNPVNSTNYTITFCPSPSKQSGLPTSNK